MISTRAYPVWAVGAITGLILALIFDAALGANSYNLWGATIIVPIIAAINIALIWRVTRGGADPWLTRVLELALLARGIGALARYLVAYVAYGGAADAERYNQYAALHYPGWRDGAFVWEWGGKQGTQVMELITTAVYALIGPSPLAGFFVFASFAFWGTYLIYRAFALAVPEGDHRRYALLVFFLPSLIYWPSSIGKEAWLTGFVGVTAYGAARFFTGAGGGLPLLLLGAVGTAMIRPHISVLMFAALLTAQLIRPTGRAGGGVVAKFLGLVVLAFGAWVLATRSAEFLGIDDFSLQAISDSVDSASEQASQGGSAFTPTALSSPLGVPMAFVTVLFRPFLFETRNPAMLVQSLEGLAILILLFRSRSRLRALPHLVRSNPYVAFCGFYVVAFIIAFAGFGNFGILARQRVLMLPFFLLLLVLPAKVPKRRSAGTRMTATTPPGGAHVRH